MANPTKSKQEKRVESAAEKLARDKKRSEKFAMLATKRTRKALTAINSISRLNNRSAYLYTEEQVAKIFEALTAALTKAQTEFKREKNENANGGFTL